jgi:hypothetical protein
LTREYGEVVNEPKHCRILGFCVSVALVAGCGNGDPSLRLAPAAPGQADAANSGEASPAPRCKSFVTNFDEFVACQRADGTLDAFSNQKVAWRVRYFVRYWVMPCSEAPTEQEAYVFHMVTDDLDTDQDLSGAERVAIRNTMYNGKAHCK